MGGFELGPTGVVDGAEAWVNLQLKNLTPSGTVNVQDWPKEVNGDLVWEGNSFASEEDYTLILNQDEVLEVRSALQHFNSLGLYGSQVSQETFPLPNVGPKLLRLAADIHRGKGFAVVRGLDAEEFSKEDNVVIFLGISCYIGDRKGRQDEDGNMLMHIRDAKRSKIAQSDRPTRYSSRASTFHTDTFCDILALQTRNCASIGGRNILSSSWTVYNKLAMRYPHIAGLLAQPIWPFDSRGKFLPCSTRPLLFYQSGRIIINFAREPLLGLAGVPRADHLPSLSQEQREALNIIEQLATESQIILDRSQPGDILFVNNHGVLHSREAFEDVPDSKTPRYLVRLWLKNSALAWKLPLGPLRDGNKRIYGDNELGERWNVADGPRQRFRLSERLTS